MKSTASSQNILFYFFLGSLLILNASCFSAFGFELAPIEGRLRGANYYYLIPYEGYRNNLAILNTEISLNGSDQSYGFRLSPHLRLRIPDARGGLPEKTRSYFDLNEGWAEWLTSEVDFRVGNQFVQWGTGDGVNPIDVWSSWDQIDPFAAERIPALAAKLQYHPADLSNILVEIVGIPKFKPDRLPLALPDSGSSARSFQLRDSRSFVSLPSLVGIATGITVPLLYEVKAPVMPALWEAGLRLRLLQVSGWDVSFAVAEFVEKSPRFHLDTRGNVNNPNFPITASLTPVFYRNQMAGMETAGSFGEIGIRAEAAFRKAKNVNSPVIPSESISTIIGVDHLFSEISNEFKLYVNTSYVYAKEKVASSSSLVTGLPSLRPWNSDWIVFLEVRTQKHTFGTKTTVGLRDKDSWVNASYRYQWFDGFAFSMGADFFVGNRDGFFGQFYENRRVSSGLEWIF